MNLFPDIVGQEKAKKKLAFLIEGHGSTGVMPHLMFVAPKGCGKTMIARAVAKNLLLKGGVKPKPFREVNCSTLKTVAQFEERILQDYMALGKEVTFLFDECSELPHELSMAFLTMLNPNKDNKNIFSYGENNYLIDFSKQSFMFATTESQTVFHALMDRCERIDLEEYTHANLGEIVANSLQEIAFDEKTLKEVSTVLRGNARSAQKMANHIRQYLTLRQKNSFGEGEWKSLTDMMGISPLGLSPIEIQVLRVLSHTKIGCTLTNIAAKLGLTRSCIQRDFESYLQKLNLMEIVVGGRRLTMRGREYLRDLEPKPPAEQPKVVATWEANTPAIAKPC